jgi:hypothetical protein
MPNDTLPPSRQLPPARPVDCACDARLHVHVLGWLTGPLKVHACLRCGTTTCTRTNVYEPRPHDVRVASHTVVPLDPALLAWVAAWPRWLARSRLGELYLDADARCPDAEALPALLAGAAAAGAGRPRGARLRELPRPDGPPPAPLPPGLEAFAQVQEALALDPDATDAAWLLRVAGEPAWTAHTVAVELLLRRADAEAVLAGALGGVDDARHRGALAALAEPPRALVPRLLPALLDALDATPLTSGAGGRGTVAAAGRAAAAAEFVAAACPAEQRPAAARRLRLLSERIGRRDWALARRLQDAARALTAV